MAEVGEKKYFMETKYIALRTSCNWKINSISEIPMKLNEFLQSDECKFNLQGDHSFCLKVYPNGMNNVNMNYSGYVTIGIRWLTGNFYAKVYKMQIFADGEVINEVTSNVQLFNPQSTELFFGVIESNQWKTNYLNSVLTIECELEIARPYCTSSISKYSDQFSSSDDILGKFSQTIAHSFDAQLFVDCTFECESQTIGAHKAILAAHSPVFQAMFTDDMKESNTSKVEVDDIEFNVFKEMLRFLYCCETPKILPQIADKLLIAANKYQLTDLKSVCENYLADHLNTENVRGILSLATFHNAPRLRQIAIVYAKSNSDQIIDRLLEISANDISAIEKIVI